MKARGLCYFVQVGRVTWFTVKAIMTTTSRPSSGSATTQRAQNTRKARKQKIKSNLGTLPFTGCELIFRQRRAGARGKDINRED